MTASKLYKFLSTKLTPLPTILEDLFPFYNNTVGNAATWCFFSWCCLHYTYDYLGHRILKRKNYKEYVRTRLLESFWLLVICLLTFTYCSNILFKNVNKITVEENTLKLTVVVTLYCQQSIWYFFHQGFSAKALSSLLCSIILISAFITEKFEYPYQFLTFTAISEFGQEFIKFHVCCLKLEEMVKFTNTFLTISFFFLFFSHGLIFPSIIHNVWKNTFCSCKNTFLFVLLVCWYLAEIFNTSLFRFIRHFHHNRRERHYECLSTVLECSLFPTRSDDLFYLEEIMKEMIYTQLKRFGAFKFRSRIKKHTNLLPSLKAFKEIVEEIHQSPRRSEDEDEICFLESLQKIENLEIQLKDFVEFELKDGFEDLVLKRDKDERQRQEPKINNEKTNK